MVLENLSHPLDFRAKVSFVTEQVIAGGGSIHLFIVTGMLDLLSYNKC